MGQCCQSVPDCKETTQNWADLQFTVTATRGRCCRVNMNLKMKAGEVTIRAPPDAKFGMGSENHT